jgi:hypothetical protein
LFFAVANLELLCVTHNYFRLFFFMFFTFYIKQFIVKHIAYEKKRIYFQKNII